MASTGQSISTPRDLSFRQLISPDIEMISDEKMPAFLSLSMTDSICSNLTCDLDTSAFEPTELPIQMNYVQPLSKLTSTSSFPCGDCGPNVSSQISRLESALELNASCVDQPDLEKNTRNFRKSMSLHDVSHIQPLQLSAKSFNAVSCETINSHSLSSTTKLSKDSGFQRSASCLSFGSGRRNYDHVQSKVKAYIQGIKELESSRKKNKMSEQNETIGQPRIVLNDDDFVMDKNDLLLKIQELKQELEEKALYIDVQQKNYNGLLLKLAEAKNTIDKLRLERISLDYSTSFLLGNSHSTMKNRTFDMSSFDYEPVLGRQAIQSNIDDSLVSNEQSSFDSCHDKAESFSPSKYSTPQKNKPQRTLNPVSKIFSSSLRLDQTRKPLKNMWDSTNFANDSYRETFYRPNNRIVNCRETSLKSSNDKCSLMEEPALKQKRSSFKQIDLPNDDPFDKVKKWQASLPNLNLLQTNSSSDSETVGGPDLDQNNPNYSRCTVPDFKENEINGFLSEALVAKCKISEKKQKAEHCRQHPASGPNRAKDISFGTEIGVTEKENGLLNESIFMDQSQKLPSNRSNNSGSFEPAQYGRPKCCSGIESRTNSKSTQTQSLELYTNCRSCRSDCSDCDSASSTDLSSESATSETKLTKRQCGEMKESTLSKIPKLVSQRGSKFVLREPKLNICLPSKSQIEGDNELPMKNINTGLKSAGCEPSYNLKTESSQRKAWNSRNSTDFSVCKEFYFKKSASLEDCFHAIEGMTQKASSIIDIALDRSNY